MRSPMPRPMPVADEMFVQRAGGVPETHDEAEAEGSDSTWTFWSEELQAALKVEERFRKEGELCEREVFGPPETFDEWKPDASHLIQSTIETLKPSIYSETPEPICVRTFRGDGEESPVERIGAEVVQRLAHQLLEDCPFDGTMEATRDDWLTAGRGTARVMYQAEWTTQMVSVPNALGVFEEIEEQVKARERVYPRHWPWRRVVVGAAPNTHDVQFIAYLSFMTRQKFTDRFGAEAADRTAFTHKGRAGRAGAVDTGDDEETGWTSQSERETLGAPPTASSRDQTAIYEIWDKRERTVKWWSPDHKDGLLDEEADPFGFDRFFDTPDLLLAHTRSDSIAPRSRIAYMKARVDEVDLATKKLRTILNKLAVVGLFPGAMQQVLQNALSGESKLIAIQNWAALADKGGSGVIQWLPIEAFVKAAQALIQMREQSKMMLYEQSGVSDIVRGQGDPNETATAQQIKGQFAGMRLGRDRRRFSIYVRDIIRLMVNAALEHFDLETIIELSNIDLPRTEAEREAMLAMGHPKVPDASWEAVEQFIRNDFRMRYSVTIETDSTLLTDEEEDRKARIEFITSFVEMATALVPIAGQAGVEFKLIKELLLFGVRGFRKARTLEGMIASLPDELPPQEPQKPFQVTVAEIRAQADMEIARLNGMVDIEEQRLENDGALQEQQVRNEGDRVREQARAQTAQRMKGLDLIAGAQRGAPAGRR